MARQLRLDHRNHIGLIESAIGQGMRQGTVLSDVDSEVLAVLFDGIGISMNMTRLFAVAGSLSTPAVQGKNGHPSPQRKQRTEVEIVSEPLPREVFYTCSYVPEEIILAPGHVARTLFRAPGARWGGYLFAPENMWLREKPASRRPFRSRASRSGHRRRQLVRRQAALRPLAGLCSATCRALPRGAKKAGCRLDCLLRIRTRAARRPLGEESWRGANDPSFTRKGHSLVEQSAPPSPVSCSLAASSTSRVYPARGGPGWARAGIGYLSRPSALS